MSNAANTVTLNGQPFEMLPLNWKQLKDMREEIILIDGMSPKDGMMKPDTQEAILKVITASLQRKQTHVTKEFVEEHLDLGNVAGMIRLCFGQNPKVTPDTATNAGEAPAATSQS